MDDLSESEMEALRDLGVDPGAEPKGSVAWCETVRLAKDSRDRKRLYLECFPLVLVDEDDLGPWVCNYAIVTLNLNGRRRVPAHLLQNGMPLPGLADVLQALPAGQRREWPAAFWLADENGYLGCSPQQALAEGRIEDAVAAARRSKPLVG